MKRFALMLLSLILVFSAFSHAISENKTSGIFKILMTMTEEERAEFSEDFADFMHIIGEGDALTAETPAQPAQIIRSNLQGEGFASAEDAAIAYLKALSAGDYAGACACYAVESVVDNVHKNFLNEESGSVGISNSSPIGYDGLYLPSESYRQWNIAVRYTAVTSQTMNAAFRLFELSDPSFDEIRNPQISIIKWFQFMVDSDYAEMIVSALKLFESTAIELKDYSAKEISFENMEDGPSYKKTFMDKFAAKDVKAIVAEFTNSDNRELAFIHYAVKYEGAWYLYGSDHFLTGTSINNRGSIYAKEEIEDLF